MSFTPGPWRCEEDGRIFGGGGKLFVFNATRQIVVAEIPAPLHDVPIPSAEADANAHLIASAPDLLRVAEMVVERYAGEVDSPVYRAAVQAIAMTRGES